MKSFAASITIGASLEAVWALLTDASFYPQWNSTVARIDGRIALGETVTVRAKANPQRAFPVTVSEFAAPHRMVWRGGMPLGLFVGTRTFTLTPAPPGGVEFTMREVFSGLLAPLIGKSIPDMQPVFDAFARDLKNRAESMTASKT
jgi:hypothetical protein